MSFGRYLRTSRNNRGLTLEDVACRIGLSVPHLSRIERDKEIPPGNDILEKLAGAIGIASDDLFGQARRIPQDMNAGTGEVFAAYRRMGAGR